LGAVARNISGHSGETQRVPNTPCAMFIFGFSIVSMESNRGEQEHVQEPKNLIVKFAQKISR